MSNWRVVFESQNEELQPTLELDFPLSQIPVRTLQPLGPTPLHEHLQEEARPSQPQKEPRVEQQWHGNLQQNARALVILLQVGCVEPRI